MKSAWTPPDLYVITDRKMIGAGSLAEICDAILKAAYEAAPEIRVAIQLREKDLSGRALYELASALRPICTRNHAALIVNDRIDVAIAANADGVHLPGGSFEIADARRILGAERMIGVSTHSSGEVERAAKAGADFAVYGPVFESISKRGYGVGRGGEELAAASRAGGAMRVIALGGITAERIGAIAEAAAAGGWRPVGAAVIGAVFGADDAARAARGLVTALAQMRAELDPRL